MTGRAFPITYLIMSAAFVVASFIARDPGWLLPAAVCAVAAGVHEWLRRHHAAAMERLNAGRRTA
jgi:hypothetical protein